MKHRVLLQDEVDGKPFSFAMTYDADSPNDAADLADAEFLDAYVVDVTPVELSLKELLAFALKAVHGEGHSCIIRSSASKA